MPKGIASVRDQMRLDYLLCPLLSAFRAPMTPAERRVASSTAPKTADGRRICWDYNSHMGCGETECPRAHEYFKNLQQLSTAVKISMAKRLGFKKGNKLAINKVGDVVRN